ncbi:UDP-glycosyltransferase UGT5-like [Bacillus rossius redtenbacheri]|uniref:UDP-glycosyltransferase UGT5-like n=1 Tax=Bacillus rossius redtenbacheri TaxID=93214 RepID=UPI002FDC87DB
MRVLVSLLALAALARLTAAARILGVFGHVGRSHFDSFQPLLEELASRGHSLVVLSHFPRASPLANYTDVSLVGCVEGLASHGSVDAARAVGLGEWLFSPLLARFGARTCADVLGHPPVRALLSSDGRFDLVLTEVFNADCWLGFARRFRAPHVALSSHVLMPWAGGRVGNPDHPGHVRHLFSAAPASMSLLDRLRNTATLLYHKAAYRLVEATFGQGLVTETFGAGTSLEDLRRNTSLVLVNTHFSVSGARPLVPGVVEVGGMHIRPPAPLPQDLAEWVSGAEHGLVYFSLGSMVRPETLPEDKVLALLQAFSELPQRVLWKWGGGDLPGRPANVRAARWLPQLTVLEHPKTLAFISHCGNLGTLEAVHAGVPVVGIPLYGDQPNNARSLEARGMAVLLPYPGITKDSVLRALRTVLEDPTYRDNAKRLSRAFNDRPSPPLQTAAYWVEYVLRHRGAPLLRSVGADLPWYQHLLLDVIGVLLLAAWAIAYLLRRAVASLRARKSKTE